MQTRRATKSRPRLTDEERDRREREKKQRAAEKRQLKAQQASRITTNAEAARDLAQSVRSWHDEHLKGWRRALATGDVEAARALAADLAAKLRSGKVEPPPWPDTPWPGATTKWRGALGRFGELQSRERQALLDVLDATVRLGDQNTHSATVDAVARLRDDVDTKLVSILSAAGATKSGRGRRRKAMETTFGDLTIAEESILSGTTAIREVDLSTGKISVRASASMPKIPPPSATAIQRQLDPVMGTKRQTDSYGRLRRLRRQRP